MYKKQIIENALPIVAAMYSRKFDVSVHVGGKDAYTDGRSITLPAIPDDYPHPESLYGFLAHEAAHVKFTNFETVNQIKSGLEEHVFNVLEDGRIENAMIDEFPGSKVTLDQAAEYYKAGGRFQNLSQDSDELAIFTGYILYWMRSQWRNQVFLNDNFLSAQTAMASAFPKGVGVKLDALLRKAPRLSSSREVTALSKKIVKMLEDEAKEDEPDNNSEEHQDDQSSNGESDSDSSEGSNGSDSDSSSNDESSNGAETDSEESEGDSNDSRESEGDASDKPDSSQKEALKKLLNFGGEGEAVIDVFDQIKESLEEAASENPDAHAVQSIPCVAGGEAPRVNEVSYGNHSSSDSVIKAASSSIRQQLLRMVQANNRSKVTVRDRGRNISGRNICKVVSGSSRIFEHKTQRPNPNTAVHLLVDASGSMNGERMIVANDSAKALGLALETLPKVNPAISYFPGCSSDVAVGVAHGESVKRNLHNINMAPNGGTPMADGIWYAIDKMHSLREERKLLIVVTDGAPHNGSAVEYSLRLAEKAGIEVMAIGIQSNVVSRYFKNYVVIDDVSDLQATLFDLMKDSLIAA